MQIKVLQHHIDLGIASSSTMCALAIREQYPDTEHIAVGCRILIGDDSYFTPGDVASWIISFDNYDFVEPFEFDLPGSIKC